MHSWSDEQARWVFRRSATLRARGTKPVNGIVLPTLEFFPDRLDTSKKTVKRFFARTLELAGLDFLDVRLDIVDEEAAQGGSCSSGGCSAPGIPQTKLKRLERDGDGFIARLSSTELGHPTVLATVMVRTVSSMFLTELDCLATFAPSEREGAIDLAGALLGFGPILMNGSAIEVKGCSGMKVHSVTSLSSGEMALAVAIACKLEGARATDIARHLGGAASAAFAEGVRFVGANGDLVERIDNTPGSVEENYFQLKEPGGLFSRAFKIFQRDDDDLAALEKQIQKKTAKTPKDVAREERMRELRDLVEETLRS